MDQFEFPDTPQTPAAPSMPPGPITPPAPKAPPAPSVGAVPMGAPAFAAPQSGKSAGTIVGLVVGGVAVCCVLLVIVSIAAVTLLGNNARTEFSRVGDTIEIQDN